MKPDIEKYLPLLKTFDLADEEKEQFIRDIVMFLEPLADKAFGRHPLQQKRGYLPRKSLRNQGPPLGLKSTNVADLFGGAANDDVCEPKDERQKHR